MEWTDELWRRFRFFSHRAEASQELEDEIQFHLAMKAAKNHASGMEEHAAERAAHREFGNATRIVEQERGVWIWHWLETITQDVRYAVRTIRRDVLLFSIAALTLALGIGANAVVFSFVDGAVTRPLPVRDPGGLVRLFGTDRSGERGSVSFADLRDFSEQSKHSMELMGIERRGALLKLTDRTEELSNSVVSANYFTLLGVGAGLGRVFTDSDSLATAAPVVVMSYNLWQRRFHGDRAILGRTLSFTGNAFTLIGVAARGFRGTDLSEDTDLWMPVSSWDAYSPGEHDGRAKRDFDVFGRLRPGVSLQQARASVELTARLLAKDYPSTNAQREARLITNTEYLMNQAHNMPALLLALVGMVLLVACANVANLLLARSDARGREIAVRLSVGCSRMRLIRQFLTESAVLAAIGTMLSVPLTALAIGYLPRLLRSIDTWSHCEFILDSRLLAFTLCAGVRLCSSSDLLPHGIRPAKTWQWAIGAAAAARGADGSAFPTDWCRLRSP
jgi:predicted permease